MSVPVIFAAIITSLVGVTSLMALLIGVGKAWALMSAAASKMDALHRRLDTFQHEQESIKMAVTEIRTVLRLHPTLRFRLRESPISPQQDMFTNPQEE